MYVTITRIPTPGVALFRGRTVKIRGVPCVRTLISTAVTLIYIRIFRAARRGEYQNAQICGIYEKHARSQQVSSLICKLVKLIRLRI